MKSLYQMLLAVGYPESQMGHHESDLYIYQTPLTNSVIDQWCEVNWLSPRSLCLPVPRPDNGPYDVRHSLRL